MNQIANTIDTYLSAWTEPDAGLRAELLRRVFAQDGQLIDPPLAARGHAEISDMAAALQRQFPGQRFRRTSGIDAHHGHLRFAWELISPAGAVTLAGLDVAELDGDGRLLRVAGFFGPLPALEAA